MPTYASEHAFFLPGPTAAGKSEVAIAFAERVGGEIVGADAFQIYAGLDVLSAKPSATLRARVPHHLIGEIPLTEHVDVARYLAFAEARIREITARGKVPVVCGGTGLYIRALTHGLSELPSGDPALRADLEKEPLPSLAARLRELDPATQVDLNNLRRVIRALEVCMLTGRPFSSFRTEWNAPCGARGLVLTRKRGRLDERINARTEAMFAGGVVAEVAASGTTGPTASQMLGLAEIRRLIAGEMSLADCIAAIQQATRRYAKRQLTWFRRESAFAWLDLDEEPDPAGACVRALKASR